MLGYNDKNLTAARLEVRMWLNVIQTSVVIHTCLIVNKTPHRIHVDCKYSGIYLLCLSIEEYFIRSLGVHTNTSYM